MGNRAVSVGVRLLSAALVSLGVAGLVFLLMHLIPGDPVDVMLGEYASVADRSALRTRLGLDLSLSNQWWQFVRGIVKLDLGQSLALDEPVVTLVLRHATMTYLLACAALLIAVVSGIPLGVLAATRRGSPWDSASSALSVAAMAIPNFVLGPLVILLFAVSLGWFPIGGADSPSALVLPALTLGLSMAAVLARMTRAAVLTVLDEPWVLAVRARGVPERRLLWRHVLPNAALPIATTVGLQLGALLGGAVITEVVFSWPGIGQLVIESIHRRDYPVVQACVLLIAISYVTVNTLTDVVCVVLDPRSSGSS